VKEKRPLRERVLEFSFASLLSIPLFVV